MTRDELLEEYRFGMQVITHKKNPDVMYKIIFIGEMKIMGCWVECCAYQKIGGGKHYVRRTADFNNFSRVN